MPSFIIKAAEISRLPQESEPEPEPEYTVEKYTIPKMLKIKQAALEFSISEYALRRWIKEGKLPAVKCGRQFLVNCTVLSSFLQGELQAADTSERADKPVVSSAPVLPPRKSKKVSLTRIKPIC